jgi:formamidopyrimidine-DNA glycosylase
MNNTAEVQPVDVLSEHEMAGLRFTRWRMFLRNAAKCPVCGSWLRLESEDDHAVLWCPSCAQ